MGSWLSICGEAIYVTRPWIKYGEGNNENSVNLKAPNVRFTRNKAKTVLLCHITRLERRASDY
nr:hypothetical protein [Zobellia laminariae]